MAHGFGVNTCINGKRLCIAAARRARYEKGACGEAETKNYNEKDEGYQYALEAEKDGSSFLFQTNLAE